MKRKSPASGSGQDPDNDIANHNSSSICLKPNSSQKVRLISGIRVPCCSKPAQITEQLAFEFDKPNFENNQQSSNSGASSQTNP